MKRLRIVGLDLKIHLVIYSLYSQTMTTSSPRTIIWLSFLEHSTVLRFSDLTVILGTIIPILMSIWEQFLGGFASTTLLSLYAYFLLVHTSVHSLTVKLQCLSNATM
jgi:hypothetical protein